MNKNDVVTLTIESLASEGQGVGRVDGMAVFVPLALPGEQVSVHIVKVLKNYVFGKVEKLLSPSHHRLPPECPHFPQCGGCDLWHMDAQAEQAFKTQLVSDCLQRIGGTDCPVKRCIMPPSLLHYRNKALFPITHEGIGFYAARSHRLVPLSHCLIQHPFAEGIVDTVNNWMAAHGIVGYDEQRHTGTVRGLYIRVGEGTGEVMVCIITRTQKLPFSEQLVEALRRHNQGITSIVHHVNNQKTNVLLGEGFRVLYGTKTITDTLCGLTFQMSPHSFYQVNHGQTEVLYQTILKLAQLTGSETVFDLYCGIGTIGLYLARYANKVVGVECIPAAIENARANAALNGIKNAQFHVGRAEQVAPTLGKSDVVVLDPPRKGCDAALLEAVATMQPDRLIYVSCNPATLARDVKQLSTYGYHAQIAQPVNLFPRTSHVECVVMMSRVKD